MQNPPLDIHEKRLIKYHSIMYNTNWKAVENYTMTMQMKDYSGNWKK